MELTDRGMVKTNSNFQTNIPNIYAIGDVIDGPMLAHKAEEEGIAVMEHLHGDVFTMHYDAIPSVVYTSPEVCTRVLYAGCAERGVTPRLPGWASRSRSSRRRV